MDDFEETIDDATLPPAVSQLPTLAINERYTRGDEVARGGMGAVYRAKDLNVRRTVAMKVLLDPESSDEIRARFIDEAQITGQLEHPNIVPVHELATDRDGNLYYAMKLIKGHTLKDILASIQKGDSEYLERYPLGRLLTIFLQACNAVAYAHSKGVVHRDLKPENIMVGDFGEVLVVDWGLVKILDRDEFLAPVEVGNLPDWVEEDIDSVRKSSVEMRTMQGGCLGTPAYMAPEQAIDASTVTELADVYAMSAVLYSILTLSKPVSGGTVRAILVKVVSGEIPDATSAVDLPHLPQGVPEGLAAVAMKGLAREPADRYASISELQQEVERWQSGFATLAESAGAGRQLQLFVGRHRALVLLSAVAMVTVIIALSIGLGVAIKERQEAEAARVVAVESETAIR